MDNNRTVAQAKALSRLQSRIFAYNMCRARDNVKQETMDRMFNDIKAAASAVLADGIEHADGCAYAGLHGDYRCEGECLPSGGA